MDLSNPILNKDSYKLSHPALYPTGIKGMSSYIAARKEKVQITFFGLQMALLRLRPVSKNDIEIAATFAKGHGEPFDPAPWLKVVNTYKGNLPIQIYAVPEGLRIPSQNVLVRVECTDPDLYWLAMDIETWLQRAVWYPSTIASNDWYNRQMLAKYLALSSDNMGHLDFMLHDFGARGVSSNESAAIAGAAHLVYFKGSDTIVGVRAANAYYKSAMAAFSVPAAEHSVQCSFGPLRQKEYIQKVLDTYAKPNAIVSIVIDGYDTMREARMLCEAFKDQIVKSGAKIVFRPDSGDPVELVPQLLKMQDTAFGHTMVKGYKRINNVGLIWGDGVDFETMESVLIAVTEAGFSADNIVFGSGGSLLQKVNRDTYGFAQKASAILVDGAWRPIHKAPVTDKGKNSLGGRLTLLQSDMNKEYMTSSLNFVGGHAQEWKDVMPLVYDTGDIVKTYTMDEVRKNAGL